MSGLLWVLAGILLCTIMAGFQLWRAQSKGERFAREEVARKSTAIVLSSDFQVGDELRERSAVAQGYWLPDKTIFLDNKIFRSRPGYHVLTPLQLVGSKVVVLVNRGWAPAPPFRSELPLISTASGLVEVRGVTRNFETKIFELQKSEPEGSVWQHVRKEDYLRHSGLDALPVILLQTDPDARDGLVREWGSSENPALQHYGYAVMWIVFALSAAVIGIFARRPTT